MSAKHEHISQLVRYASLCDILAGCSQRDSIHDVSDFITKKLRYVINGYAWTYHGVQHESVQIVARKSKQLTIERHALHELTAFKAYCENLRSMRSIDLETDTRDDDYLCTSLVIERLREVLILPIKRNDKIEAYVAYYAKDQLFDDLDKKFIVLMSEFLHDKISAIQTNERLQASLEELATKKKYSSYKNISLAMAHHINTPLGVSTTCTSQIASSVRHLQRHLDAKSLTASTLTETLQDIDESQSLASQSLERLSVIVNAFRESCVHVEQTQSERCHLKQAITEAIAQSSNIVRIEVHGDANLDISGPFDAMTDILTELFHNAFDHGFRSNPESVRTDELRIDIVCQTFGRTVQIDVRDNGCGITDDARAHVFEPFFVGRTMAKNKGLGLYNVYNTTANLFSGSIECVSSDRGAHFRLMLPWDSIIGRLT